LKLYKVLDSVIETIIFVEYKITFTSPHTKNEPTDNKPPDTFRRLVAVFYEK